MVNASVYDGSVSENVSPAFVKFPCFAFLIFLEFGLFIKLKSTTRDVIGQVSIVFLL